MHGVDTDELITRQIHITSQVATQFIAEIVVEKSLGFHVFLCMFTKIFHWNQFVACWAVNKIIH